MARAFLRPGEVATKLSGDLMPKKAEVVRPGVRVSPRLVRQPPELLYRIQPGGIGRQREDLNPGVPRQRLKGFGVKVDGPVVHDQVNLARLRIALRALAPTLAQRLRCHPRKVPGLVRAPGRP